VDELAQKQPLIIHGVNPGAFRKSEDRIFFQTLLTRSLEASQSNLFAEDDHLFILLSIDIALVVKKHMSASIQLS
jgi:hypothetical protein